MARVKRMKKVGLIGLFIAVLLYLTIYSDILRSEMPSHHSILLHSGSSKIPTQPLNRGYTNDMNLFTMFTSFIDGTTNVDRITGQTNFLKMSNFSCFREVGKFIVFTNSAKVTALINKHYPNVIAYPTPMHPPFNTAMYKDIYRTAMSLINSFFYIQANGGNLFDTSLIYTLKAIKETWMKGLIRQKIMIYGKRYNVMVDRIIENEMQVLEYFKKSEVFIHDSQDYIILTKETIEFDLFSEVLMGRLRVDNAMVDFGVHNEVESFDCSNSIHLLHQSHDPVIEDNSETSPSYGNKWNHYVSEGMRDHYSCTCARYSTELHDNHIVKIYDKKRKSLLNTFSGEDTAFFKEHKYWLDFIVAVVNVNPKSHPDLVVVVLACNKPDSLNRLFDSLVNVDYEGDRIDLVVSLDIGYLGFYDLPTLILIKKLSWSYGKLKVVLKREHRGQLNQWLEAYSSVESGDNCPILILEDNLMLSPFWYEYLKVVLSESNSRKLHETVAGWSLEAPYPGQAYPEETSVMMGDIRWVRSFVPVLTKWISFLQWYNKESRHVPLNAFKNSPAFRLDNRGNWSNWESSVWANWYWYYCNLHSPDQQGIVYMFDKRGSLASKTRISYVNWQWYGTCYLNGTLESDVNFGEIDPSEKNHDIKIPDVIPIFSFEPFAKVY